MHLILELHNNRLLVYLLGGHSDLRWQQERLPLDSNKILKDEKVH